MDAQPLGQSCFRQLAGRERQHHCDHVRFLRIPAACTAG
jgi:hypothetical protein